ncbi:SAM-dependent methyltransferase [Lacunimicrobium album]
MPDLLQQGINLVERGLVPDLMTRFAIRRLCAQHLQTPEHFGKLPATSKFLESLTSEQIAVSPEKANEQHYELPAAFFELVLGPRRKYSCCLFDSPQSTLEEAEIRALQQTCSHAELSDGQSILELGCGWGSLSLWMAESYPSSQILALSNSTPQRLYIEQQIKARSLSNLRVITADINKFVTDEQFDRVVSVEMFEHLRNFELVLRKIAGWLKPSGQLFVHHFCHRTLAYPFEVEGSANWMGRYFFTGGIMPSADLLSTFNRDLVVSNRWDWSGKHYQRTSEAWLVQLDQNRPQAMEILKTAYGPHEAERWFHRWRMFFLAVAELFGFSSGKEWFVTHQLLKHAAS